MRPPRYPLEPLAQLRAHKVDEAVRLHATAIRAREDAQMATQAAEDRRLRHERDAAAARASEGEALGRGELRAADLARADSWGARTTAQERSLGSAVDRAASAEKQARDAESAAQADIAARQTDTRIVAKDRDRWEGAQRQRIEARDEEALNEACRPKR